jgi:hypothetical protein
LVVEVVAGWEEEVEVEGPGVGRGRVAAFGRDQLVGVGGWRRDAELMVRA